MRIYCTWINETNNAMRAYCFPFFVGGENGSAGSVGLIASILASAHSLCALASSTVLFVPHSKNYKLLELS